MGVTDKQMMIGGGVLLTAALVYMLARGARGIAQDATRAGVNVAGGVVTGTVNGMSDIIGLPVPERSACDAAKASGSTFDVSLHCPAGEFFNYLVGGDDSDNAVTVQSEGWNDYDLEALRMQGASGQ